MITLRQKEFFSQEIFFGASKYMFLCTITYKPFLSILKLCRATIIVMIPVLVLQKLKNKSFLQRKNPLYLNLAIFK